MKPTKLMVPTVHLNGTSKEALMLEHRTALDALRAAHGALCSITCHGRDYYVQEPRDGVPAFQIAQEEHRARIAKIEQVIAAIEEIAIAINRQGR